jgi:hypothetical protein
VSLIREPTTPTQRLAPGAGADVCRLPRCGPGRLSHRLAADDGVVELSPGDPLPHPMTDVWRGGTDDTMQYLDLRRRPGGNADPLVGSPSRRQGPPIRFPWLGPDQVIRLVERVYDVPFEDAALPGSCRRPRASLSARGRGDDRTPHKDVSAVEPFMSLVALNEPIAGMSHAALGPAAITAELDARPGPVEDHIEV